MLMGIIPNLGFLKLDSSGFMRLVLSTNCAVRRLLYPQCHICHQRNTQMLPANHQGEVLVKDRCINFIPMEKNGMLWKNYGKAMEFLFWRSVRTLYTISAIKAIHFEMVSLDCYVSRESLYDAKFYCLSQELNIVLFFAVFYFNI